MRRLILFLAVAIASVAQLSLPPATTVANPVQQFVDVNGKPLAGAFLCTFAAGTSTPLASYADAVGTPNPNPIVLDAAGRTKVYWGPQYYKEVLYVGGNGACPGTGSPQFSADVFGDSGAYFVNFIKNFGSATLITYTAPYTGAVTQTVANRLAQNVQLSDFQGFDNTGATDSAGAFDKAFAVAVQRGTGVRVNVPCGTYLLNHAPVVSLPTISVIGENESCVQFTGGTQASIFQIQMVPFTTTYAGEFANFTVNCNANQTQGILSGQIVGAFFHDIDVSSCVTAGSAGFNLHNIGAPGTTWTERNIFLHVSAGAKGSARNARGFLLGTDVSGTSFGYNRFIDIGLNVSTGQIGFDLQGGFFYNSIIYATCNTDNGRAGTVGAICFNSNGNWSNNKVELFGEVTSTSGPGTGTSYAVQVPSTGRFANLQGSAVSILAPGGGPLPWNVLVPPTNSPNVTLMQTNGLSSYDTGSFTVSGIVTNPQPGMPRGNYGSIGMLIGPNIESPYVSMFQGTGNKFIVGVVPTGGVIGTNMIDVAEVDAFGNMFAATYNTLCNITQTACHADGSVDGQTAGKIGGYTNADRSGYTAFHFAGITGFNEQLGFSDPNFQTGLGSVFGTNIAHMLPWGYTADPLDLELAEKRFQQPIIQSDVVMQWLHGGQIAPKGHIDQMTAANNIGGTCSVTSATSCQMTFTQTFNSTPVCTGNLQFQLSASTVRWWIVPSTAACTVNFESAQTGTIAFHVIGNPN